MIWVKQLNDHLWSVRRGAAIRLQLGVTRTRQNDLSGGNRQQMNSTTDNDPRRQFSFRLRRRMGRSNNTQGPLI